MCEKGSLSSDTDQHFIDDFINDDDDMLAGLRCGSQHESDNIKTLHEAVRREDLSAVQRLLEEGHDPDEPDWSASGDPPLLQAAALGNVFIVRALCKAGCDVNARSVRGESALHLSITNRRNSELLIETLLNAGCDANIQDNLQGQTALHCFIRQMANTPPEFANSQMGTFQLLARKTNVNLHDHRRRTPIHRIPASGCNQLQCLKILIDYGANISLQNDRGETALHEALEHDWPEGAIALITAGTDLTKATSYHETALHVAARKNRPRVVATLLQHNAPLNARDLAGNSALHLAASRGFREVVRLLLEYPQTELNASNKEGLTPLHVAVESGFIKVVEMLLQAESCDLKAKTKASQTALDLAKQEYRRRSQPEMLLILTRELERREQSQPSLT